MKKRRQNVITHPAELSALSTLPWRRMPGWGRVVVADNTVPESTRLVWEQQLNRLYFACGCDRAALGLVLGIIGFGAWVALRPGRWSSFGGRDVVTGVIAVGVVAGTGKLTGLIRANEKLKRAIRDIQHEWKRPRTNDRDVSTCG